MAKNGINMAYCGDRPETFRAHGFRVYFGNGDRPLSPGGALVAESGANAADFWGQTVKKIFWRLGLKLMDISNGFIAFAEKRIVGLGF
jgi:hypothetical protein